MMGTKLTSIIQNLEFMADSSMKASDQHTKQNHSQKQSKTIRKGRQDETENISIE